MSSFLEKLKRGMGIEGGATEDKGEEIEKPVRKKRQARLPDGQAKIAVLKEELPEEPAFVKSKETKPPRELKIEQLRPAKREDDEGKMKQDFIARPEPVKKIEIEGIDKPAFAKASAGKEQWFEEPAGQLAVDVFQTESDLIIQTAIAGINPGNLEITIEKDIVSIKGIREKPAGENGDYFTKECYWGPFSREVIAPVEIDPDRVEAAMQEGVLTIKMPKLLREKKRTITVNV